MADYKSIIEAVKKAALENALEDYELYLSSSESIGCETFRDELSEFSSSKGESVYFRCVKNTLKPWFRISININQFTKKVLKSNGY